MRSSGGTIPPRGRAVVDTQRSEQPGAGELFPGPQQPRASAAVRCTARRAVGAPTRGERRCHRSSNQVPSVTSSPGLGTRPGSGWSIWTRQLRNS